ncbi:MAG TPA: AAA family ATPase [Candidatus Paceibacterota bacterium]|nr:AAA family ATPase [Candidatus Paceibacterota bacterium]
MIIGITGTIGAGKGTVVDYLKEKGFAHYSVRDVLMKEIEKRGLPPDRDSMRTVGNELRALHGPDYFVKTAFEQAEAEEENALIESVRAMAEAEFLKSNGALLLAVDADRRLRYERIQARGLSTDHVDFDTWVAQERKELTSADPNGQNIIGVMLEADYLIENDGTLEELHQKIDEMFQALL